MLLMCECLGALAVLTTKRPRAERSCSIVDNKGGVKESGDQDRIFGCINAAPAEVLDDGDAERRQFILGAM